MTLIYLVRHAQCVGNVEKRLTGCHDYALTKEGKNQAQYLKKYLGNIKFDCVYSSTFRRAIETVKPIADMQGLSVQTYKELSEMDFGSYDGYTWEEVDKLDKTIMHNSKKEIIGIPKQETTKHVQERMMKIIKILAEKNNNKTILICSHGIAIEAFLRGITKVPFNIDSKKYSQNNTSVNIISYNNINEQFTIKKLSEMEHLLVNDKDKKFDVKKVDIA